MLRALGSVENGKDISRRKETGLWQQVKTAPGRGRRVAARSVWLPGAPLTGRSTGLRSCRRPEGCHGISANGMCFHIPAVCSGARLQVLSLYHCGSPSCPSVTSPSSQQCMCLVDSYRWEWEENVRERCSKESYGKQSFWNGKMKLAWSFSPLLIVSDSRDVCVSAQRGSDPIPDELWRVSEENAHQPERNRVQRYDSHTTSQIQLLHTSTQFTITFSMK